MISNMSLSNAMPMVEMKRKEELVLAALTVQQAVDLAATIGPGKVVLADNVGIAQRQRHHDPNKPHQAFHQYTLSLQAKNRVPSTHLRWLHLPSS
jgi:hypothetical protein